MTKEEAEKMVKKVIEWFKSYNVDHYSVNHVVKGKQNYLDLKISIKLK
jgi:hypothetical protein